jgi:predicted signal transduction protein with EAL and GGDEF domain
LAIDDAGAGYASLRHVVTLSPDIIKIDRTLIADLNSDRARRALVMAVVVYAMEIGTTMVIGEGVETTEELEALRSLGVDAAQGYLRGRPPRRMRTGSPGEPKPPLGCLRAHRGSERVSCISRHLAARVCGRGPQDQGPWHRLTRPARLEWRWRR